VVLSMADKVVLGNGEGFQARRVGGERWEGRGPDCLALNPIRPRHFWVRSTTLQTEKKAKVGRKGRVCLAMTSSLILP
jgi:hypothetical protein